MREIKFRGQNFGGHWIYSDKIGLREFFEMLRPDGSTAIINQNTVGEFSGLKDRNGKEIYEGDILQIGDHKSVTVEFHVGCFKIFKGEVAGTRVMYHLGEFFHEVIEIIGNIYENTELLTHSLK